MLVAAVLGLAALSVGAPVADAKTACWRQILNEWVDNRQIASTYPLDCYREAIQHVPEDLRVYTDIEEAINAARQQAVRSQNLREPQASGGPGAAERRSDPNADLFTQGFDKLGPNNADSMPLPLLILGGLALLLVAAGGAGLISRRIRGRRVPAP